MIQKSFLLLSTVLLLFSCSESSRSEDIYVNDIIELNAAISNASPGDEIIMTNNDWTDVEIRFVGYGTEQRPITLKAETPGKVLINGKSDLKLGGEYLIVDGLYFTDGMSPSNAVIEFAINQDTVANHSKVTNCVILDFNKGQRNQTDLWVLFKGRHNELTHSYIAGKANRGPTVRVDLEGNKNIKNYHKITNNHFGPRPPKGGPSAETIQLGNSYTSMAPSYTLVANNLFDRCNGEVEIISSKTNFNEFRNNVFYKSEGSLVTRHGNYCTVDGNYFIGDSNSEQIGGVRLIGTGHWVTNNYFYNLKGKVFRSPLAVMNGIPKSPLNRYIQVTDVVVAYNSWINCISPWQFGVGSNTDQKDVLPASEIRSERPIRTLVANNLIFNRKRDEPSIVAHDSLDGIIFKSNIINSQGITFQHDSILKQAEFSLTELDDNIFIPAEDLSEFERFSGFEFDLISKDLFGNSRAENNSVGAIAGEPEEKINIMDDSQYGPFWYSTKPADERNAQSHLVSSSDELQNAIKAAAYSDTIILKAERYALKSTLKIDKKLTIRSADIDNKATIQYLGEAGAPAFEMNPKGELSLIAVILEGNGENYAFAPLKENMSSLYNLNIKDSEIFNFDYVLKGFKHSFAEYIKIRSTTIQNCKNGLELSAEDDDRGDYNAENVIIADCTFSNISKNVIDYYRGGYDESTVGGNLTVTNSTFTQSGSQEENGILIDTYGIINVNITGNTFRNNNVRLVARLWGAKNNTHSDNMIENSGKLIVEENLPLKLMY
ncbi:chondroitinase-B domain-containing protein [Zeaxanthinibacter enoshimensis]|uniref:Poly(Beta-D-mannuronate) lyase n=1 Tax=Zeaxanthinibacter enoshimensis TaxID=392009 RepID=A0A4R6TMW9_9FLAO|nr:chondroitinase-B domain-containing protein [Zeaxanthinibacter enoshimensis]TDQ32410.1 poly(beta-D-mannuronate) lyase [Zeaxanthinibacter enoshimensis]